MNAKEKLLDAETLRKHLRYYPASGNFYWLTGNKNTRMQKAGCLTMPKKRIVIMINHKPYYAHRLAWLYMTSEWPKCVIDHISGDSSDNSFANLRDVSLRTNTQNQKRANKRNKIGYMGVVKSPRGFRYRAHIFLDGKRHTLGHFDTPQEAHECYLQAKRKMHPGCTI